MGLVRAGFDVTGVDLVHRPSYPFRFMTGDMLTMELDGYDLVHVSAPCQRFSRITRDPSRHPDLITPMRARLLAWGGPYLLENVPGAPLVNPVTLCGSMFGLHVRRHRNFESNQPLTAPKCSHANQGQIYTVTGHTGGRSTRDGNLGRGTLEQWRSAMGISWMSSRELAQAIPPAYAEYLGNQLISVC